MNKIMNIRNILFLFISVLMLTIIMVCYSTSTSPLYPASYGWDSALFRFFGSELLHGKALYRDIWDHKGPVIYLINAVGALGGTGNRGFNVLFLLQLASLFVTFLLMYLTCKIIKEQVSYLFFCFSFICSISIFIETMEGGNLTEEWSLPAISCSIYLFVRYCFNLQKEKNHPCRYALIHGICFSLLAFIRVNNAISIFCGAVVIGIYLISQKKWKNLFQNLLFGLAGVALITIPIIVYAWSEKIFDDMIYAIFFYNFIYLKESTRITFTGLYFFQRYLPLILSSFCIIISLIKTRSVRLIDNIAIAMVAGNAIILIRSNIYLHYFTIFIPVFMFVMMLYFHNFMEIYLPLYFFLFLFFAIDAHVYQPINHELVAKKNFPSVSYIPKTERKSTVVINVSPAIYLNTGIKSCSRITSNQSIHLKIDKEMKDEFITTVLTEKPFWIITNCGNSFDEIDELLKKEYSPRFNDPGACYFRRNE
ncbi:MAG: hypothetical protein IJI57_15675 [Flexilinea sp.]|nr:hypothetical protein [Flexilinea sp.]